MRLGRIVDRVRGEGPRTLGLLVAAGCLWIIRQTNRTKDRELATLFYEHGGLYATRPQDGWKPPPEWECWRAEAPASGGHAGHETGT